MEAIRELLKLDFTAFILTVFVAMSGLIAMYTIISKFCDIIGKPIKWFKNNNNDHDVIIRLEDKMKEYAENRIKDRQQSFEIQKKLVDAQTKISDSVQGLKDSIKTISDSNVEKDKQITSLIHAQKEMLAEKINEKYKYYLSIGGVPEDERDEFISLHDAYKGVGGNHNGDAKFEYCINHLPIIPVETKLVFDSEE